MIRRLPHGGTSRPQLVRPGNGYGRRVAVGPPKEWRSGPTVEHARRWDPAELLEITVDLAPDAALTP